jgi:hypothetical protein
MGHFSEARTIPQSGYRGQPIFGNLRAIHET